MFKYAKIINQQTGLCEVGTGTNTAFYKSIGMTEQDVLLSDIDGNWYLADKCPRKSEEQKLSEAKIIKQAENTRLAKLAVENGHVVFKGAEFETNAQTVGDLTATMLLMQASGLETYLWLSKDDQSISLSIEDFGTLGGLIAEFKNTIWQEKYLYFKSLIESATTIEEVEIINIDYTIEWLTLTIKPTPTNATVLIDGEPITTKTKETYQLKPATFEYLVVADGYNDKTGKIAIAENTELEIKLEKAENG